MDTIILAIHLVISVLLVGLILIQHGKGADAGAAALGGGGGGASSSLFGSQGSASFLSRSSSILATLFFISSLTLAYFAGKTDQVESVTELPAAPAVVSDLPEPTSPVPAAPEDLPDLP